MSYLLGIDLGATVVTAAVLPDGGAAGPDGVSALPAVLVATPDGDLLCGDAARRRAPSEPDRVARGFLDRVGDPTPLSLGDVPYRPEDLCARLVRRLVDDVVARYGTEPARIAVTHPVAWGRHKKDLLAGALARHGLTAALVAAPQAVALAHRAAHPGGAPVAVVDLGGSGTTVTVLSPAPSGGMPVPAGRAVVFARGGADVDDAVFAFVRRATPAFDTLDVDDPRVLVALAELRDTCRTAKEVLSADTVVTVPVDLPGVRTSVRIHRADLDELARPVLEPVADLVADVVAEVPDAEVLLAGGSARMPVAVQVLSAGLGRPLAVCADPVHDAARGAALAVAPVAGTVRPAGAASGTARAAGAARPAGAAMGTPPGGVPAGSWAAPRIPAPREPGTPPGGVPAGPRAVPCRPAARAPEPRRAGSDRTAGVLAAPPAAVPAPRAGGGAAVAPEAAEQATAASGAGQRPVHPRGDGASPAGTAQAWPVRPRRSPPALQAAELGAPAADTVVTQDTGRAATLRAPARRVLAGAGGIACAAVVAGALLLWPSSPASIGELSAAPTMPATSVPAPVPVPPPAAEPGAAPVAVTDPAVPASAPTRAATAPGRAGTADATVTARSRTAAPAPDRIPGARPRTTTPVPGPVVPPATPNPTPAAAPDETPVTPEPTTGAPRTSYPVSPEPSTPPSPATEAAPPAGSPPPTTPGASA
ncbi:Hsp70 family protein [Pseudonocardia sp. C8]|uniref:Hsp70 family protein n=1 Tax=Pseudonocardia sp. C8 TaxID=2762759 RepID=UPI00164262D8|nr:Hsp70 family protein [Pseudonocardia sp. C8]MBC3194613.1 Hsp70 family protein [Pseudonocardia sp. C8]